MTDLITGAIARINSLLNTLQVKQFLAVVLVGFFLLTSHVDAGQNSRAVTKRIDNIVHQNDSQRPKTTGEWNREAQEKNNVSLGERTKAIAEDSAEAVEDFGSVYPSTAQRSARNVREQNSR